MTREQLCTIIRFSNLDKDQIAQLLENRIYPNERNWHSFLQVALLVLGAGFLVSGIVFFFAYNWDSLPDMAKLIITQSLVALTCIPYFLKGIKPLVKNISLTASAILVGGMLAVFGQIYQTEAMAFDLLLSWTLAVTLWVVAARFAPLTLLWLILVQTTVSLYYEQVLHQYQDLYPLLTLSAIGLGTLLLSKPITNRLHTANAPKWFTLVVAVSCAYFMLSGVGFGLEQMQDPLFILHAALTISFLIYMTRSGFKNHDIPSLVIAALSAIIAVCMVVLIKIDSDEPGLIFLTVFILSSVVYLARQLTALKKKWDEQA